MKAVKRLIRADGSHVDLSETPSLDQVMSLIGTQSLGLVQLRFGELAGHVMYVDDLGVQKDLPVNAEGTRLYHKQCHPGVTWQILGDVVVIPGDDGVADAG